MSAQALGDVRPWAFAKVRRNFESCRHDGRGRGAAQQPLSSDELVEDDSQREYVDARVDRPTGPLLRGHVARSSGNRGNARALKGTWPGRSLRIVFVDDRMAGQPEVKQLDT